MDKQRWQNWVDGYLRAWESNDPADIGSLFTADALYYTAPFREPWRSRDAIVTGWLKRLDEPGTWQFEYVVLGVMDDVGVVRGRTVYPDQSPSAYSNLWLVRLDEDGRCAEFTEWWMAES